jgi:uncharacterized membrane protein YhaH (DUF805 family)
MEYMFMPLKRYADFSGRSRRMEYWMWVVFQFLIGVAFWVLMMVVGGVAMMGAANASPNALFAAGGSVLIIMALWSLVGLAMLIPGIAVAVRRLHDTNRSGWWLLAPLGAYCITWIGLAMAMSGSSSLGGILAAIGGIGALVLALVLLVFMFLEGTRGPNRYGADPKGGVDAQVFA